MSGRLRPPATAGRLERVAPVPFVGLAAILVALIVFTPVLLASGPSPLEVHAELEVYRVIGSPSTEYSVHGYDPGVGYRYLNVSLGTGFTWNGGCPTTGITHWSYTNETNETIANVLGNETPVVVNVSAIYQPSGPRSVYAGEIAFQLVNVGLSSETIAYAPCPYTANVTAPGSWSVGLGTPLYFPLVDFGAGGPP